MFRGSGLGVWSLGIRGLGCTWVFKGIDKVSNTRVNLEFIENPRKLEHGFRLMIAGTPYTLPWGQEENDAPTCWLPLFSGLGFRAAGLFRVRLLKA